jgi:hypothetical protein
MFHHLCDLDSTDNRVCTCNGWDNISSHVLNFVESLLFYAEAMHSEICSTSNKVNNVVIVFFESNHPIFNLLFGQSEEGLSEY